ncbi:glycosyltransferase family 39 protein [Flavobacterium sp.]|uniref:glycosyltransferase family 39 protein n=1 Tax=Flavobacterium sp. TaxID=239 RepID=UPI00404764AA
MNFTINLNLKKSIKIFRIDVILFSIILLASFLRIYHLGFQSAWLDEIHTLKEADPNLSLSEFHSIIMMREGIPHFYFLTIRFFAEIFGHSIYLARLFSAIAGIASVYYIFLIGKELLDKRTGYIAALLLTVNLFHIEFSQEARSYSLLVFFILIATHRLLVYSKNVNYKNAILLGFFTGLIPNAHPIGLLNVMVIFSFLFFLLIRIKERDQKKHLFKNSLIVGVVFLIVFSPVYVIVSKVSDIQSFWIPIPTIEAIKNVFIDLSGRIDYLFYINVVAVVLFFLIQLINFKNTHNEKFKNDLNRAFVLLILWLLINAGVIILKSYTGVSIILNRYFIGVLPAMILITAFTVSYIASKYSRYIVVIFVLFSLYYIFFKKEFYTTIIKAEFEEVTNLINTQNPENHKVYSSWGWLMSYFIDPYNEKQLVTEINLTDYIKAVKNNAVPLESFWYMDGNSRPYFVDKETQSFLNENYEVKESLNKNDAWVKHFVLKNDLNNNKKNSELYLSQFTPFINDGKGNLLMFENSTIKAPQISFKKGDYRLIINGNSHPDKPINGENAHLTVKLNDVFLANYYLNEDIKESKKEISFSLKNSINGIISITFDNDLSINGLDRNVLLYSIKLETK